MTTPHSISLPNPVDRWPFEELNRRFSRLSQRKYEILVCISNGESNKEIAARLGIAIKTVEKHLTGLFVETGFPHRLDAAVAFTIWTLTKMNKSLTELQQTQGSPSQKPNKSTSRAL